MWVVDIAKSVGDFKTIKKDRLPSKMYIFRLAEWSLSFT